jgi:hypothetical protein
LVTRDANQKFGTNGKDKRGLEEAERSELDFDCSAIIIVWYFIVPYSYIIFVFLMILRL